MMMGSAHEVLAVFDQFNHKSLATEYILKRTLELLYDAIIVKYGGSAKYYSGISAALGQGFEQQTLAQLIAWFDQLCQLDLVMGRTSKKQLVRSQVALKVTKKKMN
jgi:hypothetical protein